MINPLRLKTLSALLLGAAVMSGCSILPKPAPPDVIYRMSPGSETVSPNADADVLQVDRPSAVGIFNSNSIVATPDGRRLSSVSQAKWPQPIPSMVQSAMVDALHGSPRIVGVLPSSGTRTDTRLHITIKNFEAQFDRGEMSAPLAVVRYTAELNNSSDRKLLATFSTRQTVRADQTRVSSIVEAMEEANAAAMADLVAWLEQQADAGKMVTDRSAS